MGMKKSAHDWAKSGKYLPEFMRDFHDQKDLFKTIQRLYAENDTLKNMPGSWVDHHVYTIDYFLWFMAQHGYTLQRNRSAVEFYNIHDTIKVHMDDYRKKAFAALHSSNQVKDTNTNKEV